MRHIGATLPRDRSLARRRMTQHLADIAPGSAGRSSASCMADAPRSGWAIANPDDEFFVPAVQLGLALHALGADGGPVMQRPQQRKFGKIRCQPERLLHLSRRWRDAAVHQFRANAIDA